MRTLVRRLCLRMLYSTSIGLKQFAFALLFSTSVLAQQSPLGDVLQGSSDLGRAAVTDRNPNPNPGVTVMPPPESAPAAAPAPPPVIMQLPTTASPSSAPTTSQREGLPLKNIGSIQPELPPLPPPPPPVQQQAPAPVFISPNGTTLTYQPPASTPLSSLPTLDSVLNKAPPATQPAQPGGISLSKAAAERMPLEFVLDASSFFDGKIVLSGRPSKGGIDAALFLTTLRAACDDHDPYFSLDPDNGALWSQQGERASEEFWERIKKDFPPQVPRGEKRAKGVQIHTVSAIQNYPGIWHDISPHYPNFRSKLVFYPEWLRLTRLGEILYKADVLLKELSAGVSILAPGMLRASAIPGYLSSDAEFTAKSLLAGTRNQTVTQPQWRGSRLWFDIAPSAPPTTTFVGTTSTSSSSDPALRSLLQTNGFMRPADQVVHNASFIARHGNVFDLSNVNPTMFVRVHDPATNMDLSDHDPRLDGLAADVSTRFDQYAASYDELRLLRDVFRAYIAAVKLSDGNEQMCRALDALPLNESEKVAAPLPDYHPSELFVTVGNYWTTSKKGSEVQFARTSSVNGGVSIAGQEFAESATRESETAITRAIEAAIAIGTPRRSNLPGSRVFVAFTVDDASGKPLHIVSNASNPFSPRNLNDYQIENEPSVATGPLARQNGQGGEHGQSLFKVLLALFTFGLLLTYIARRRRISRS